MNRRTRVLMTALLTTGALALGPLAATRAGAVLPPPPTGSLSCGATGAFTLKPGIPGHTQPVSAKNISEKVTKGVADHCNNAGQMGGKAPINAGSITFTGVIPPGATCDTLLSAPPNITKPHLTIKLQNSSLNPRGRPVLKTVAIIKPINLVFSVVGATFAISGDIPQNKKGNAPFGGETFSSRLNADNVGDAIACISGPVPLTHFDFSNFGGSSISVAP